MKPSQDSSTTALDPTDPPPNAFSILIVDDLPENRRFFSRLLATVGYRPMEAQNGTEAINDLVRRRPHLVIMDVEMPGMSGIDAVREIRRLPANLASTPIIAGSGNPESHLQRDVLAAGADAFLAKPMDVGELLETISILLRRHWQRRLSGRTSGDDRAAKFGGVGNAA